MNPIEEYVNELGRYLRVRGAARRRFLRECRDHLDDASAIVGPVEAVRRFGAAASLAASFDLEVAARRSHRSTMATVGGVLAVGGSTLALIQAAGTNTPAVVAWAVTFFLAAQVAALSVALAALQAAALRRTSGTPADLSLLCRRNTCALAFAGLTMFAAAAAIPGSASAAVLLSGPALAALAAISVARTRLLLRRIDRTTRPAGRTPLADIGALLRRSMPEVDPVDVLIPAAFIAAAAAFAWDRGDHATVAAATVSASVEAAFVVLGFFVLGPPLGLRPDRHSS